MGSIAVGTRHVERNPHDRARVGGRFQSPPHTFGSGAWGAILRLPGDAGVPLVVAAVGNPELQSEQLTELEAGYRFQVQVDASLYHVGRQSNEGPEAYTRGDARVELTISDRLSAVATGHNLFDPAHAEYAERFFIGSAVVPRRNGELVLEVLTRRPQARLARRSAVGVLAALLLWNAPADAQGVTGPMLKAAFLYNFANFAEWPAAALAPAQPLSLCVIGDNAVAHALEQTIKGRKVDNHELTVAVIKADGQGRSCHLLYISGLGKGQAGRLLQSLKDTSTFTVGDGDQFAAMGGVAQLILENDRMRFPVNVDAAHRARLKISSKLLGLARIVKDQPDVRR